MPPTYLLYRAASEAPPTTPLVTEAEYNVGAAKRPFSLCLGGMDILPESLSANHEGHKERHFRRRNSKESESNGQFQPIHQRMSGWNDAHTARSTEEAAPGAAAIAQESSRIGFSRSRVQETSCNSSVAGDSMNSEWPFSTLRLKEALDLLLQAYDSRATLNDINIILSLVLAKEEEE